jgi:hypothetical protein
MGLMSGRLALDEKTNDLMSLFMHAGAIRWPAEWIGPAPGYGNESAF